MPPGIFILLILWGAFFYKKARIYLLLLASLFYLFSTKAIGNFLLLPFEQPYNHIHTPQSVNAMVILAGGTHGKSANLTLAASSYKRLIYGTMIAKQEQLPIIFSGQGLKKYSESMSAKDSVAELNHYFDINLTESTKLLKDTFSIFYENKSLNTYENAKFTKKLFADKKIEIPTIYLVTSAFHMKRSIRLYKYFGFHVIPVATDFMTTNKLTIRSFFPSHAGLQMSYHALHEYAGLLQLSLKLK